MCGLGRAFFSLELVSLAQAGRGGGAVRVALGRGLVGLMSRQPRPISVCDLSLSYSRHPAVRHLCCHFAPGSLTAVVGPNGAGKSTLLKALAGLLPPRGGRIDLGGQSVRDLAYLPQ